MKKIIDLLPILKAIDGVEDVERKQKDDEDIFRFRYCGIKFTAASYSGGYGVIFAKYLYKPKLLSGGKAKSALIDWATNLISVPKELKFWLAAVHVSDHHIFHFPFTTFSVDTVETILRGFVEEFPNILEQFSKDGQVEFDNAED